MEIKGTSSNNKPPKVETLASQNRINSPSALNPVSSSLNIETISKANKHKTISGAFIQFKKYIQEKYSSKDKAELFKAYSFPSLADVNSYYGKSQNNFHNFEFMIPLSGLGDKAKALNDFFDDLKSFKNKFQEVLTESSLEANEKDVLRSDFNFNLVKYVNFLNKMLKTFNPDIEHNFSKYFTNLKSPKFTEFLIDLYTDPTINFKSDNRKDIFYSSLEQLLINDFDSFKDDFTKIAQLIAAQKINKREGSDLGELININSSKWINYKPEDKIALSFSLNLNSPNDIFLEQTTHSAIAEKKLSPGDKFNFPELLTKQSGIYLTDENAIDLIKLINEMKNSPSLISIPSIKLSLDIDSAQSNFQTAIFYNVDQKKDSRVANNTIFAGLESKLKQYPPVIKEEDDYLKHSVQAVFNLPLKFNDEKENLNSRDLNISAANILKQSFLISSLLRIRSDQKFLARSINLNKMKDRLPLDSDELLSLITEPFSEQAQKTSSKIYKEIVQEQADKGEHGVLDLKKLPVINSTIDELEQSHSLPSLSASFLKQIIKTYAGDEKINLIKKIQKSNIQKLPIIDLDSQEIKKLIAMSIDPSLENKSQKVKNILDFSSNIEWDEFIKVISILDPKVFKDDRLRNDLIKKLEPTSFQNFVKSISFLEENISKEFFEKLLRTKVQDFLGESFQLLDALEYMKEINLDSVNDFDVAFVNEHNLELFKDFVSKHPFKDLEPFFLTSIPTDIETHSFLSDFLSEKNISKDSKYSIYDFKEEFPEHIVNEFFYLLAEEYQGETRLNKSLEYFQKFENYIKEISVSDVFKILEQRSQVKKPFRLRHEDGIFYPENLEDGKFFVNEHGNPSAMIPRNRRSDTLYALDRILEKPIKKFSLPRDEEKREEILGKIKNLEASLQERVIDALKLDRSQDIFDLQASLGGDHEQAAKDILLEKINFNDFENFKYIFDTEFSEDKRLTTITNLLNLAMPRAISKADQEKFRASGILDKYIAEGKIDSAGKNFLSYRYRVPFLDYLVKNVKGFNQDTKNFVVKILAQNTFLLKGLDRLNLDYDLKLSFLDRLINLGAKVDYKLIPVKKIETDNQNDFRETLEKINNLPIDLRSKVLSKTKFSNDEQLVQALSYSGFHPIDKENIAANVGVLKSSENIGIAFDKNLDLSMNARVNLFGAAYRRHDKEKLMSFLRNLELDQESKEVIKNFTMINGSLFDKLKDFGFTESNLDEISAGVNKLSKANFSLLFDENISLKQRRNLLKSLFRDEVLEPSDLKSSEREFIQFSSQKAQKYKGIFSELGLKEIFVDLFHKNIINYKYLDRVPFSDEELFKILDPEKNKNLKTEDFDLILRSRSVPHIFKINLINDVLRSREGGDIRLTNHLDQKLNSLMNLIIEVPEQGKIIFDTDPKLSNYLNNTPHGLKLKKALAEKLNKNHEFLLNHLHFPSHEFPKHKYYALDHLRQN